jgi:predicted nucleotidyltransferase
MAVPARRDYSALHELAELGRRIEQERGPDPYPRPTGPAPRLEELRQRRSEILSAIARHGAKSVRVFGSVASGDNGADSDLDLLVEFDQHVGLFGQASLQSELEELLGCRVHVTTVSGLHQASSDTRDRVEREAIAL